MSVKYIVSEKGNPSKPDERKKFYATAKADGKITFRKLSKEIANSLTFLSDTEVMAVLNKLTEVFRIYLKRGYIVNLDEFGLFQVGLLSEGTDILTNCLILLRKKSPIPSQTRISDNTFKNIKVVVNQN